MNCYLLFPYYEFYLTYAMPHVRKLKCDILGRFVNHSCDPNTEIQKWCVNGLFRMTLFAIRDIQPGEELGYDYNFSNFNSNQGQVTLNA